MTKRISLLLTFIILCIGVSTAQIMTPVRWSAKLNMTDDTHGEVLLTASIGNGWHMYSHEVDPGIGPQPLEVTFPTLDGVQLDGKITPSKPAHKQHDDMFDAELSWWSQGVTITQKFTATKPEFKIGVELVYSACNDENCIPPARSSFTLTGTAKISAPAREDVAPSKNNANEQPQVKEDKNNTQEETAEPYDVVPE
ncbi:MAG: protein-disulfide reductase DsbD N-terminal domain-containing protein, partial [Duncaniella sp.]|nr:protein-disulfide reductase DsbD N-terminal domain-containing protein [Duncaniella sp.]